MSASLDGSLKLWDLRSACLSYTMRAHKGPVLAAAFSADGLIASAGTDQRVLLWASNLEFPNEVAATSVLASTSCIPRLPYLNAASSLCSAAATSTTPFQNPASHNCFACRHASLSDDMLDRPDCPVLGSGVLSCCGWTVDTICSLLRQCSSSSESNHSSTESYPEPCLPRCKASHHLHAVKQQDWTGHIRGPQVAATIM